MRLIRVLASLTGRCGRAPDRLGIRPQARASSCGHSPGHHFQGIIFQGIRSIPSAVRGNPRAALLDRWNGSCEWRRRGRNWLGSDAQLQSGWCYRERRGWNLERIGLASHTRHWDRVHREWSGTQCQWRACSRECWMHLAQKLLVIGHRENHLLPDPVGKLAHLTGLEPAFPSAQGWSFSAHFASRFPQRSVAMSMPWVNNATSRGFWRRCSNAIDQVKLQVQSDLQMLAERRCVSRRFRKLIQ